MIRTAVRDNSKFNEQNLQQYLIKQLPNLFNENGHFQIEQFVLGQSNPTYFIDFCKQKVVLRKKPAGILLKSAHMVDREYKIIQALWNVNYPVAEPIIYCGDVSIIGTEFYLTRFVNGRIFQDPSLPNCNPLERQLIYEDMLKTLVKLHKLDYKKLGLQDYGNLSDNYFKRQISTWSRQYRQSETEKDTNMETLMEWLPQNMPASSTLNQRIGIIHGDYKINNMIFHPTEPRVLAVLDWELSTIGNVIGDFAYNYLMQGIGELGSSFQGLPYPVQYKTMYCNLMDTDAHSLSDKELNFYLSFGAFKMAAITQGVFKRSIQGNASSTDSVAKQTAKISRLFAQQGIKYKLRSEETQESKIAMLKKDKLSGFVGSLSEKFWDLKAKLLDFMLNEIYPNEHVFLSQIKKGDDRWTYNPPIMEALKKQAQNLGLWNLFLPAVSGLSNLEYAILCEITGRSPIAPEALNCSAPDTGNMEVLWKYGNDEQKKQWLEPLLKGDIRSCFSMTEKGVPSSDATNISSTIIYDKETNEYVINGRKWWISGAGDPRCKFTIFLGRTPNVNKKRHQQLSMILIPMDTPGVKVIRPLEVFQWDDAPHGHMEIDYCDVRVPVKNMILGEGRGFEIAQGRLGPGRIHHCMRLIGLAERSFDYMKDRTVTRKVFGKYLAENNVTQQIIAKCRIEIDQARLLVLHAAVMIDKFGAKAAKDEIAMIKVVAPNVAATVTDRAIQIYGGEGVSQDTLLTLNYSLARTLRLADGPDEVHEQSIAKSEISKINRFSQLFPKI